MKTRLIVCYCFFLCAGCAEQATRPAVTVPVEERHVPLSAKGIEDDSYSRSDKPSAANETVILALVNEARSHAATGRTDRAAAAIERALKIEPANASLWHELARVRLQQQRWQQAIVLARKSNSLAGNDPALQSANWGIIAQSYEALGEIQKALEAREQQRRTS